MRLEDRNYLAAEKRFDELGVKRKDKVFWTVVDDSIVRSLW